MEDIGRVVVQFLHVTSGILWIGGGFYTLFVQLPALLAAPAEARGPVMAQLAPRQIFYILRVAELTIATGVLQIVTSGRAAELSQPFGSRWAASIVIGVVLALVLYATVRAIVRPAVERMLAIGRDAARGEPVAPAEMPALVDRVRRIGQAQVVVGLAIVFVMVLARFS